MQAYGVKGICTIMGLGEIIVVENSYEDAVKRGVDYFGSEGAVKSIVKLGLVVGDAEVNKIKKLNSSAQ